MAGLNCAGCGKPLNKNKLYYISRIELYAAPRYEFSEEELRQDHCKEIKNICEQMKGQDKKKLEEEVYVCFKINLCKTCRDRFSARIKHKEFI